MPAEDLLPRLLSLSAAIGTGWFAAVTIVGAGGGNDGSPRRARRHTDGRRALLGHTHQPEDIYVPAVLVSLS